MVKSKSLKCVVSGYETVYSGNFLQKKIEEFGSEEKLELLYICKQVKALLKKNYSIKECRKLLQIPDSVPELSQEVLLIIEKEHMTRTKISESQNSAADMQINQSDKEVEFFINKLIIKQ
jgi:DNA-binding transcriptional MerR regulator